MKIYFSRVNSVVSRVFGGIAVYIANVQLSGTEEYLPWLGALSVKILEFKVSSFAYKCISQSGLGSFYQPCSKKTGLNFRATIPIQCYRNMSGYNTGQNSDLH